MVTRSGSRVPEVSDVTHLSGVPVAWKRSPVATLACGLVACSSSTDPGPVYELATLDQSQVVLMENPEVTVLADQRVRVRIATQASECSPSFDTRVRTDAQGATVIEPYDEVVACSSRVAKILVHDVTLDFDGPRTQTIIVVWTATRDGGVIEDRTTVFWRWRPWSTPWRTPPAHDVVRRPMLP